MKRIGEDVVVDEYDVFTVNGYITKDEPISVVCPTEEDALEAHAAIGGEIRVATHYATASHKWTPEGDSH